MVDDWGVDGLGEEPVVLLLRWCSHSRLFIAGNWDDPFWNFGYLVRSDDGQHAVRGQGGSDLAWI